MTESFIDFFVCFFQDTFHLLTGIFVIVEPLTSCLLFGLFLTLFYQIIKALVK